MKQYGYGMVISLIITWTFVSCRTKTEELSDDPTKGTIHISVEQSFRPVIEQQIRMYEESYPGTKIIAHYKPESDCLRDFFNDTLTRLVIISRGLTADEDRAMKSNLGYIPGCQQVASDAVVLIINPKSKDSLFTLDGLRQSLTGKSSGKEYVFDGRHSTGTVRYIRDSILYGAQYDSSVVRAKNNAKEVIQYVSSHENAIGIVGIGEIGNPEDTAQVQMSKTIRFGYVRCDICQDSPYVKPVQQSLITRRYPLSRGVYYAIKENFTGLGSGFTSFLKYERGQLIFRRAYWSPVMDLNNRNVRINTEP